MKNTYINLFIENNDIINREIQGEGEDLLLLLCNTYHYDSEFYRLVKDSIYLFENKETTLSIKKI